LLSKSLVDSETIKRVFTQQTNARMDLETSITQSWQLVMVLKMEWTTGLLRTLGVLLGVIMDISRCNVELICVVL